MIKKIIRFKEVSSTQDTAKRFLNGNEEVAITALRQTHGKGRQGRSWFSPVGGLYLSLLIFPRVRLSSIPLLASLTVVKVLENYDFSKLTIRWPNDVLLNHKKICGVICEQCERAIICGIGMNVNIDEFTTKLNSATSLKIESGRDFDIDEILNHIIGTFNPLYNELQNQGLRIKEVLHYIGGIGEPVELITTQTKIKGIVYDIDDDWALLLRDDSGMIRKYYCGEVKQMRW